jgi:hypothetical protein
MPCAYKEAIEAHMSDELVKSAKAMLRLFRAAQCEFLEEDFPGIVALVGQDCQRLEDNPLNQTFVAILKKPLCCDRKPLLSSGMVAIFNGKSITESIRPGNSFRLNPVLVSARPLRAVARAALPSP